MRTNYNTKKAKEFDEKNKRHFVMPGTLEGLVSLPAQKRAMQDVSKRSLPLIKCPIYFAFHFDCLHYTYSKYASGGGTSGAFDRRWDIRHFLEKN